MLCTPRGLLFISVFALLWFFLLGLVLVGMNVFLPMFVGICWFAIAPWTAACFILLRKQSQQSGAVTGIKKWVGPNS